MRVRGILGRLWRRLRWGVPLKWPEGLYYFHNIVKDDGPLEPLFSREAIMGYTERFLPCPASEPAGLPW